MSSKGQNVQNPGTVTKDGELQLMSENITIHKEVQQQRQQQHHELELKAEDLSRGFQQSLTTQINRVPKAASSEDHEKYYFPKVVSIGPFHYGKKHLKPIQNLKLDFAKDLFSTDDKDKLQDLLDTLGVPDTLKKLREQFEEKSTDEFSDAAFTGMMLLDGCFILYYILLINGRQFETKRKLSNHQLSIIRQDLFLLENQIPFSVLLSVMNHMKEDFDDVIKKFIVESTFSPRMAETGSGSNYRASNSYTEINGLKLKDNITNHLLHLLLLNLTNKCNPNPSDKSTHDIQQRPLPTVKELMYAGIRFKRSYNTTSLTLCQIHFSDHWWRASATVKLPPILVEEASTKYLFLNLMAYEASLHKPDNMWVTSYICLLNSLISRPEDVKVLRDAGVFSDSQGSDDEVKKVIKDMAPGIVPDNLDYRKAMDQIQQFYDRFKGCNIPISEFRENYCKSPWTFLALVGAILALLLTAVQTYFTVWSPKGECDDLCKFLKMNHHL